MTDKNPYAPVLRTQTDVEAAWRHLIHPLGWPEPRLWFMFVGADGVPFPQLCQIEELPAEIGADGATSVAATMGGLISELGFERVEFLLCRPGGGPPSSTDRQNAETLYAACRAATVPLGVIHLATDKEFWPIPLDAVSPANV
ncbi:hypothetical protein J2S40_001907 [Nocardioides luteus]|uniref:DUF695 domain-containing protein n=1 Tax=Nocardioides luteus TaxID=1844 RepID=A0ABQ5SZX0_9ACTN|nr:hypothetical protein [Nocardioides luteus]MDR7310849.1 hypothetical protein [Nocardioides luteus]GGR40228.1 hypothetical protein GCM10010197_01470 [Nocardioides luteus]GLJ69371.1 hypothetical protein GCM10017579_34070 [Nocardioides luteus]